MSIYRYFFLYHIINKYNRTQLIADKAIPNYLWYIILFIPLSYIFGAHFPSFVWRRQIHITEKSLSCFIIDSSIKKLFTNHSQFNVDILLPISVARTRAAFVNKDRFIALHFGILTSRRYLLSNCLLTNINVEYILEIFEWNACFRFNIMDYAMISRFRDFQWFIKMRKIFDEFTIFEAL